MEDFVTYEQAVKLKELGFNWECHYHYDTTAFKPMISPNFTANDGEGERWIYSDDYSLYEDMNHCQYCSAPTLAQAAKWLREEYGLHINVSPFSDSSNDADNHKCEEWYFWDFSIINVPTGSFVNDYNGEEFDTYESALSAGIDKALELLEQK